MNTIFFDKKESENRILIEQTVNEPKWIKIMRTAREKLHKQTLKLLDLAEKNK